MPISIVCPSCSAKLNASDAAAGKKIKCPRPGCGQIVEVPEAIPSQFEVVEEAAPPKAAPKKVVKVTVEDVQPPKKKSREEDEDDEDDRPRSRRRDEDDDEDDRPRSRRRDEDDDDEDDRPRNKRRRDDDNDDDEDERPRKKKKKKKQSGGLSPALLAGIVVGVLLLLGGVGYGVYALAFKKTETAAGSGGSGGGSGSSSNPNVPAGWIDYKPPFTGFKAYFPVTPEPKPLGPLAPDAVVYEGENKALKTGCAVIVFLSSAPIPANKRKEECEEKLKTLLTIAHGKELSHKDATLSGLPAVEYLVEVPPESSPPPKGKTGGEATDKSMGRSVLRVMATENKVYIAAVSCDTGMPTTEWINGFFDNFQVVK